jgi:isomerase DpgB
MDGVDVMHGDNHLPALRIDGARPLTPAVIGLVRTACDQAEDSDTGVLAVHVSGTPTGPWADGLTVALVNKWERELRRLERLPVPTVAVASGDCGGPALDALLAADYRIAAGPVRLFLPVAGGGAWPGMAVYRLAQQGSSSAAVRRAVLFAAPIDIADALAAGLVDEVVDDDADLALKAAGELAARVQGSELAVRRALLAEAAVTGFEEALGTHLAACDRALRRVAAGAAT